MNNRQVLMINPLFAFTINHDKPDLFSVHGGWTSWTLEGRCNAARCETGTSIRSRSCTNPRPRNGGRPCMGRSYSREPCVNDENCPSKR